MLRVGAISFPSKGSPRGKNCFLKRHNSRPPFNFDYAFAIFKGAILRVDAVSFAAKRNDFPPVIAYLAKPCRLLVNDL